MFLYVFLKTDTIIIYPFLRKDSFTSFIKMEKAWEDNTLPFLSKKKCCIQLKTWKS